jgi:hypothetical protein
VGSPHTPSNYYQIDNVPSKPSIVTISPQTTKIVNVPLNDETTLNKEKNIKLKKKKKLKENSFV